MYPLSNENGYATSPGRLQSPQPNFNLASCPNDVTLDSSSLFQVQEDVSNHGTSTSSSNNLIYAAQPSSELSLNLSNDAAEMSLSIGDSTHCMKELPQSTVQQHICASDVTSDSPSHFQFLIQDNNFSESPSTLSNDLLDSANDYKQTVKLYSDTDIKSCSSSKKTSLKSKSSLHHSKISQRKRGRPKLTKEKKVKNKRESDRQAARKYYAKKKQEWENKDNDLKVLTESTHNKNGGIKVLSNMLAE